ncbi:MAG TPA: hypothetical protein VH853_15975 [Polyangia bacterium]|jgi:hypothetical protein|nr:hypothetical protein [Polyangia bacterium]
MGARAAAVAVAAGFFAAGCGGPTSMGGFSDREARVTPEAPTTIDACSVRTGLLIVEAERIVVNEYPHHESTSSHAQQPLLVRSIFSDGQKEGEGDIQAWVSPMRYRPGEPVVTFAALRLLERPLRTLTGRHIIVRLAENDRTSPARWNQVAGAAGDAAGATGSLGVPVVPSALVEEGMHLLSEIDRDDLVLLWSVDAASLVDALAKEVAPGASPAAHALRFSLATPRRTPAGKPAATVDLVVFRQPEPGCP